MHHLQPPAFNGGDRRRIGRVQMHHDLGRRIAQVHPGVDREAGRRRPPLALDRGAVLVDDEQPPAVMR